MANIWQMLSTLITNPTTSKSFVFLSNGQNEYETEDKRIFALSDVTTKYHPSNFTFKMVPTTKSGVGLLTHTIRDDKTWLRAFFSRRKS